MGQISLSGAKTTAQTSVRGTLIVGDAVTPLPPNAWYEIKEIAPVGSVLPIGEVTAVFKSPDTGETPITPILLDDVYPITLTRLCKTDADLTMEEGEIDATDDCENGFDAMILDGYVKVAGTLNGFLKFDDVTGELSVASADIFKRFINTVADDGTGTYVVTEKTNEKVLLFILLNKDAPVGGVQNFVIVPAIITGLGSGAGLKDIQKRDVSWTKAQGWISLYQRTVFAADVA